LDQAGNQPSHPIGVAGGLGMVDGQLGQPVGLTPDRRSGVQFRDQLGLTLLQLGPEQLAEQVVVAVPLPLPVKRDHQQVGVSSDSSTRPDPLVARTASHSGPDRRSSTAVRVRNVISSGGRWASSSERR
jgi:hypothetical protein